MPKAKLKIGTNKVEQLKAVAELNDVKLNDFKTLGETTFVEMNYKQAQQLFEMGTMIGSISADQAKAFTEVKDEKQPEPEKVKK